MSMKPGRIVHMTAFNDIHPDGDITMTYKARKGDLFAFVLLGTVSDDRKEKKKARAKVHADNIRRLAKDGPEAPQHEVERSFPGPFDGDQTLPSIYRVLLSQLDFRRPQDMSVFELASQLFERLDDSSDEGRVSNLEMLNREFPRLLQILKTEVKA